MPKDALQADVREMSGLFKDMAVGEQSTATDSEAVVDPSQAWKSSLEHQRT